MSAYEADPRVEEFTAALTAQARRCYGAVPGQVTHAHLLKALDRGWAPRDIAKSCSRDLPTVSNDAYRLIQKRIQWFADHPPRTEQPRPAGPVAWCGLCDDTSFRYEVNPQSGKPVRPCPRCHPSTQLGAAS
jgi:hypothetical protein